MENWYYFLVGVVMQQSIKFTDRLLRIFYYNLSEQYQSCIKSRLDKKEINNQLSLSLDDTMNYSPFSLLDSEGQKKVNKVFHILISLLKAQHENQNIIIDCTSLKLSQNGCNFSKIITNNGSKLCESSSIYYKEHQNLYYLGGNDVSKEKYQYFTMDKVAGLIVLIALLPSLVVLTTIALYSLLNEFLNGIERFYYGEGWLKMAFMMANTIFISGVSLVMSFSYASPILINLSLTFGLNPAILVITAAVCISIISSWIGCYAFGLFYDFIDKRAHRNALDPADSLRFGLTVKQEQNLIEKKIDPLMVKCALVFLRTKIACVLDNDKPIPSFLNRMYGQGRKVQKLLQQARQLRNGLIDYVEVDNLKINCSQRFPVIRLSTAASCQVAVPVEEVCHFFLV